MTEPETSGQAENQQPIGTVAFLLLSVVISACFSLLFYGVYQLFDWELDVQVLAFASVAGFAVSTAGWYIVVRGFGDVPEKMMAYFGAGLLTKLVLLGVVAILIKVLDVVSPEEFFVPFAAVFFLTGFAQLYIAIKGATRFLNQVEGDRVWEQPAAPGMARDPNERQAGAENGD